MDRLRNIEARIRAGCAWNVRVKRCSFGFPWNAKDTKTNTLQTRCLIALLFLYLAFYTNPLNTITAHCKSSVNDHDLNLKQ